MYICMYVCVEDDDDNYYYHYYHDNRHCIVYIKNMHHYLL